MLETRCCLDFNPPAPCGAGPPCPQASSRQVRFQSTRPVRGGTWVFKVLGILVPLFQSTRPVRGGTRQAGRAWVFPSPFQSTRPVRGGTRKNRLQGRRIAYFNPPAPCGAGLLRTFTPFDASQFQSTRPVRGGTVAPGCVARLLVEFQSTRPVRGGTSGIVLDYVTIEFQSTRPVRGGTEGRKLINPVTGISIHPPRAGRDNPIMIQSADDLDFNPPAPCGAGLVNCIARSSRSYFNPPAPCGAGPHGIRTCPAVRRFQSTRPVRGGTR